MKKILYPILAVIVFVFAQSAAGVGIIAFELIKNPELLKKLRSGSDPNALMNSLMGGDTLSWAIIISGIVTIGIIALLKMVDWKHVMDFGMVDWKWGVVSIIACVFGIFATNTLEEIIDLPNLMEEEFTNMSNSLVGALSIGLIGPVIEEFIFREGVEGYMLRNGVNKWVAISASALVFGIIHLNPAQVPFAAAMGFLLGIIYYKTGNIVITSILHIVNNSVAVWQMYTLGEAAKDYSMVEELGGLTVAIPVIVVGIAVCVFLMVKFWKKYPVEEVWNLFTPATNESNL